MRRSSSGRRLELSPRDIVIFETLCRYRYLRSPFLHAFAGGQSETRFKERLGDLFHEGFLARPEPQWQFGGSLHTPIAYELDRRGERALGECGRSLDNGACTFLSSAPHRQFSHSMLVCAALASIEIAARSRVGVRFVPWCEILGRAPSETRASPAPFRVSLSNGAIVPDGLFGLEYELDGLKRYRFFALEVDRGTMPVRRSDDRQSSLLGKLRGYREILDRRLHKSHWGISTLFVLTLTTRATRHSEIERVLGVGDPSPAFLFKTISGAPAALLKPEFSLLDAWERPGLGTLCLAEST